MTNLLSFLFIPAALALTSEARIQVAGTVPLIMNISVSKTADSQVFIVNETSNCPTGYTVTLHTDAKGQASYAGHYYDLNDSGDTVITETFYQKVGVELHKTLKLPYNATFMSVTMEPNGCG
jgi:hypothetical protein